MTAIALALLVHLTGASPHIFIHAGTTGLTVTRYGKAPYTQFPIAYKLQIGDVLEAGNNPVELPYCVESTGLQLEEHAKIRIIKLTKGHSYFLVGVELMNGTIIHYGAPALDGTFESNGWSIVASKGSIVQMELDSKTLEVMAAEESASIRNTSGTINGLADDNFWATINFAARNVVQTKKTWIEEIICLGLRDSPFEGQNWWSIPCDNLPDLP